MRPFLIYGAGIAALLVVVIVTFFNGKGTGNRQSQQSAASYTETPSNNNSGLPNAGGDPVFDSTRGMLSNRVYKAKLASQQLETEADDSVFYEDVFDEEILQAILEKEARRKKEAAWWESRKEWVENFPYEPKYHPKMKFTEELLMPPVTSMPRPDPLEYQNRPGDLLQNMTDFETDYQAYAKEYNSKLRKKSVVGNHYRLIGFYNNGIRYTEAFERYYHIMNEYGYAENTPMMLFAFNPLIDYNKAALQDPDEMWSYKYNVTWGEEMANCKKGIVANMTYDGVHQYGDPRPSREEARDIMDALLAGIPPEKFAEIAAKFTPDRQIQNELKEGDPLLYR